MPVCLDVVSSSSASPQSSSASDSSSDHSEICELEKLLETEEEVKKSPLRAKEDEVTEKADVPNQHTTEEQVTEELPIKEDTQLNLGESSGSIQNLPEEDACLAVDVNNTTIQDHSVPFIKTYDTHLPPAKRQKTACYPTASSSTKADDISGSELKLSTKEKSVTEELSIKEDTQLNLGESSDAIQNLPQEDVTEELPIKEDTQLNLGESSGSIQNLPEEDIPESQPAWVEAIKKVVSIYEEDLDCLQRGRLLNDKVIEGYLQYILHEIIPAEFKAVTYVFNPSFCDFVVPVFKYRNRNSNWFNIQQRALNWVKNVDIFSKDFIFVPVHSIGHWYLAVVCFLPKVVKKPQENEESLERNPSEGNSANESQEKLPYCKEAKPCVLVFDCDKVTRIGEKILFSATLIEYFEHVWNNQNPREPRDWDTFKCYRMNCPQAKFSSETGLYTLQYVESFFKHPIPDIGVSMPLLADWFPRSVIDSKREEIKEVLSKLVVPKSSTDYSSDSDVDIISD